MKIAEVTATFPPYHGGVGYVAYHNARLLAERGHQVTVITPIARPRITDVFETSALFVKRLPALFSVGNAPFLPHLSAALKGYDLIHLHYPFIFGAEAVMASAARYRTPVVLTYHNRLVEAGGIKKWLFIAYNTVQERRLIKQSTIRIAVSQDHFSSLFPNFSAVEVPNGVDTAHFVPSDQAMARQMLQLPVSRPMALFVGGLDAAHRFKNVPALLRVAARIPGLVIVIIGRGESRQSLVELSCRLGLAQRTRFDDQCPTSRLPLYYQAADFTVLPSNRTESFGMVLAESMACATPVIATDLPGVRSVVTHNTTGLIVPVNDDNALFASMQWMMSHDAKRRQMGRRGRTHVENHYAWPVIADALEKACEQAVEVHRMKFHPKIPYNA
ncbi:MAG: glycosyltransferase family 1 protein [Sulfobacillus acidophilus]|uniref:Glycosyltransferase family 1 protein n=1 Tax=Sulfobacillus acidophilus TaxID=53633 RepID=A0A2T2WNZ5_9FIRM|nr:MAG: glycosyltransferase family 1 protein [Sulfobacillus acidophilus]